MLATTLLPPLAPVPQRATRTLLAARSVAKVPAAMRAGAPDDVLFPMPFGAALADAVFRIARWCPAVYVEMLMLGRFPPLTEPARRRPKDMQRIGGNLARLWVRLLDPDQHFTGGTRLHARAAAALRFVQKRPDQWASAWLRDDSDAANPTTSNDHLERGLAALAFVVVHALLAVFDPTGFEDEPDLALRWNGMLDGRDVAAALYQLFQPLPDALTCAVLAHRFLRPAD